MIISAILIRNKSIRCVNTKWRNIYTCISSICASKCVGYHLHREISAAGLIRMNKISIIIYEATVFYIIGIGGCSNCLTRKSNLIVTYIHFLGINCKTSLRARMYRY